MNDAYNTDCYMLCFSFSEKQLSEVAVISMQPPSGANKASEAVLGQQNGEGGMGNQGMGT